MEQQDALVLGDCVAQLEQDIWIEVGQLSEEHIRLFDRGADLSDNGLPANSQVTPTRNVDYASPIYVRDRLLDSL